MEDDEVSDRSKGGWVVSLALAVVIGAALLFVLGSPGNVTGTSIYNEQKINNKDPQGLNKPPNDKEVKEFTLLTSDSGIGGPQIEVGLNDTVVLMVSASGEDQGIEIPGYGIEENSIEGKVKEIKFKADKSGEFNMGCGSYCGNSIEEMDGKLIVE